MSARTTRTRMLAAATFALAALTLTACNNGEGVRDEGASAGADSSSVTPSPKGSEGSSKGAGQADAVGSASGGDKGTQGSTGSNGTTASPGTTNSSGSADSDSALTPCTNVRTTATVVSRPLNHLLLTVTNTGSKNCNLTGYPAVRFGEAQSVPPVFEDSKPQAVTTLAPGESGYAGVLLSAADGSGSNGYTAKSLTFHLKGSERVQNPSLPAKGVYVDDSIQVTYWQSTMDNALTW
ncbi:DUF4232 domain-containing protein [Streptomyces sp. Qhu-G9]|uniref:DUF4232 domain-containing protein n=1 Tax=Streptomyces sp. Qhu-G9 TaxID=3452799 RepID=UPI0022ABF55C|nr:DUF4232 domain-containing protein [Streptomyces aurantiacus]WAU79012.1 DUF4232 domain-containing protein [Streptomyces aurantiacus]